MKKTISYLQALKARREPIVVITGYDYPTAVIEDDAGVDAILIGDSVGTNVLGYSSEREVTLEDMAHHVRAVSRGAKAAYLLADLPFGTYSNAVQALESSRRLIQAGADGVKLEGPVDEIVRHLTDNGIEVCGHLGYTPQRIDAPTYQAKTTDEAMRLLGDARALEQAGAKWIVLELVPEEVAGLVSRGVIIPIIGIGAGREVDGQVLVAPDLLGVNTQSFKHNKRYEELRPRIRAAIDGYAAEVRTRRFPEERNSKRLAPEELTALTARLDSERE